MDLAFMRRLARAAALAWACLLCAAAAAQAETIQVTTTEDLPVGSSVCPGPKCSLRAAVAVSKSGDTVQLGGTEASPKTYELTLGSQIEVGHSLTIAGDGVNATTISGFGNRDANLRWNRILKVAGPEASVRIEGLTFTGGLDENDENCTFNCTTLGARGGGALLNAGGKVQLSRVELVRNGTETSGQPVGGGVASEGGELSMVDVAFREDRAAFGGGLFAHGGSVTGNRVTFEFEGDSATDGGALFLYRGASVRLENTTVYGSGWVSGVGGGIDNSSGTLTLLNDTLAGNTRGSLETDGGARTIVQNTIIASGISDGIDLDCVAAGKENAAGAKTANPITEDLGNNVDQDGACGLSQASDRSGVDPKLAPAANNGGAVATLALLSGSPALEHGNPKACPATDARVVKRPQGETCDIGAFEAVLRGKPSATTEAVTGLGKERVTLRGGELRPLWSLGLFAGPALVAGAHDLRERALLGDTGASLLGALAGLWLVLGLGAAGQAIALGVLISIALYAEFRSLSELIERTPGLRELDSLGRPS